MRSILAFLILVIFIGPLVAAENEPIELTIEARAIEKPIFKYRLLPAETEIKPGNAVPILLRLPWEETLWMKDVFPTLPDWEKRPLDAPDWKTSNGVLSDNFYVELKRAAFRRDAFWEYPIGETQSPYSILLPDVQGLRGFLGHGLSARIRYHLSRGELDKAREGILVGLANGRHVAQTPFYVNQLVALAIHRTMLDRVDELVSQPNSPNLYWALTTLPSSLLELNRAASFEANLFASTVPAVDELDRPREAREWRRMARQLAELLHQSGELPKPKHAQQNESVVGQIAEGLAALTASPLNGFTKYARTQLPRLLKTSEEKVAAMSDDEAAIRWYAARRLNRDYLLAAAFSLPPREAWPLLKESQNESLMMQKAGLERHDPTSIYVSVWSFRRRIESLRIIEAVRNHLATHDGKLPETLDAITEIPIPLDPLTDRPFIWKVDGDAAILSAPPLVAEAIALGPSIEQYNRLEYRLVVR
jgi:hypothetical protein